MYDFSSDGEESVESAVSEDGLERYAYCDEINDVEYC